MVTPATPPQPPDYAALIAAAQVERRPIPLDEAQRILGDQLDERGLADETLMVHGDRITLTPSTWIRAVRRAQNRTLRLDTPPAAAWP